MSLAIVHSRALDGLKAPEVTVEVHLANGLPTVTLVGLADTEVKEARERVRAAIVNSGLVFPHNKRITVNLAPADLPKDSGRFDLPIALGILAASGQIEAAALEKHEFAGELGLGGDLRPVRGGLALAAAVHASGLKRTLVLPVASAAEASLVQGIQLASAVHLLDLVRAFLPGSSDTLTSVSAPETNGDGSNHASALDLRDVKGQSGAKRALEVAAAGGHSLLMVGPPGTGKSMLAQRFARLLPGLEDKEALASAAILSLAGRFELNQWRQRIFRAPHHTASSVALVGGGSPPQPGEISLAHHGVLFLDELPEFPRAALEALREPLETGQVTISRAARQAQFPARFQLVAAMNPCPCGHAGSPLRACRCTPDAVARYQGRLSGPLLDRIDVQVEVGAMAPATLAQLPEGETTEVIRLRVAAARLVQVNRQGCLNAALPPAEMDGLLQSAPEARAFLQTAAQRLGWSARGYHRIIRLAQTIADLAGSIQIDSSHLAEAMQYRRVLAAQ